MIGMIRGYAMNSEKVLCEVDTTDKTTMFVANGLGDKVIEYLPCVPLNISFQNKTIAGILITDIRKDRDCWLTIYSISKRWATRAVIRKVFQIVFDLMGCKRCSAFVSQGNKKSFEMCLKLGFQKEGLLRNYRDNGENCYVMGMLKEECQWIKEIKK